MESRELVLNVGFGSGAVKLVRATGGAKEFGGGTSGRGKRHCSRLMMLCDAEEGDEVIIGGSDLKGRQLREFGIGSFEFDLQGSSELAGGGVGESGSGSGNVGSLLIRGHVDVGYLSDENKSATACEDPRGLGVVGFGVESDVSTGSLSFDADNALAVISVVGLEYSDFDVSRHGSKTGVLRFVYES